MQLKLRRQLVHEYSPQSEPDGRTKGDKCRSENAEGRRQKATRRPKGAKRRGAENAKGRKGASRTGSEPDGLPSRILTAKVLADGHHRARRVLTEGNGGNEAPTWCRASGDFVRRWRGVRTGGASYTSPQILSFPIRFGTRSARPSEVTPTWCWAMGGGQIKNKTRRQGRLNAEVQRTQSVAKSTNLVPGNWGLFPQMARSPSRTGDSIKNLKGKMKKAPTRRGELHESPNFILSDQVWDAQHSSLRSDTNLVLGGAPFAGLTREEKIGPDNF